MDTNESRSVMGQLILNGKHYNVRKGLNIIGRNKAAHIIICNANISHNHAIITVVDENQHYLSEVSSTNGTYIDNVKLKPYILYPIYNDSQIKLADLNLKYVVKESMAQNYENNSTFNNTQALNILNLQDTQVLKTQYSTNNLTMLDSSKEMHSQETQLDDINEQVTQEYDYKLKANQPDNIKEADTNSNDSLDLLSSGVALGQVDLKKILLSKNSIANDGPLNSVHEAYTQAVQSDDIHEQPTQFFDQKLHENPSCLNADTSCNDSLGLCSNKEVISDLCAAKKLLKPIETVEEATNIDFVEIGSCNSNEEVLSQVLPIKRKSRPIQSDGDSSDEEDYKKRKLNPDDHITGSIVKNILIDNTLDSESDTDLEMSNMDEAIFNETNYEQTSYLDCPKAATKLNNDGDDNEDFIQNSQPSNKYNLRILPMNDECTPTSSEARDPVSSEICIAETQPICNLNEIDESTNESAPDNQTKTNKAATQDIDHNEIMDTIEETQDLETQLVSHESCIESNDGNKEPLSADKTEIEKSSSNMETQEIDAENCLNTEDIFQLSTQVLIANKISNNNVANDSVNEDLFMKPTQVIADGDSVEKHLQAKDGSDDEIFVMCTQKLPELNSGGSKFKLPKRTTILQEAKKAKEKSQIDKNIVADSDDDIYLLPTQVIDINSATTKSFENKFDDDIFLQPTQAIACEKDNLLMHAIESKSDDLETEQLIEETQPITLISIQEKEATLSNERCKPETNIDNNSIFFEATQRIEVAVVQEDDVKVDTENQAENKKNKLSFGGEHSSFSGKKSGTNESKNDCELTKSSIESQLEVIFASQSMEICNNTVNGRNDRNDISTRPTRKTVENETLVAKAPTRRTRSTASKAGNYSTQEVQRDNRKNKPSIVIDSSDVHPLSRTNKISLSTRKTRDDASESKSNNSEESNAFSVDTKHIFSTSANRNQRHKIVFTRIDDQNLEEIIKKLGGSICDEVSKCTVLIAHNLLRTKKILEAISQSKPICKKEWLYKSQKAKTFLDPWDYLVDDKESESKWQFSLRESLSISAKKKLFETYKFQIGTNESKDILKAIIESAGGKCVSRAPSDKTNFYVISDIIKKSRNPCLTVKPEGIYTSVLKQVINFEEYLF